MVEVALNDSRFRPIPKVRPTLAAERKSVGIYKGRLCSRGDSVPLTRTPFTSIPTTKRRGTQLVIIVAAFWNFGIRSAGVSQAFLKSDNFG